ncbi:MAG: DnaJ domain-containing protein [Myxococcales bacterium]|nr:DnaJ domain-containing protein [Myxococcales bacterium]
MAVSKMDPKDLKKWLLLVAILYLVFPRDLIPDYMGRGLGLLDDLVVMGLLAHYFRGYARKYMAGQNPGGPGSGMPPGHDSSSDASRADLNPHAILGISPGASQDEIQSAYRARMREYHPDKVAHLGEELQELAHRRSIDIQQAYQRLRR